MELLLTNHAQVRAIERFGWDRHKLYEMAVKSLNDGVYIMDDEVLKTIFISSVVKNYCKHRSMCMLYMVDGVIFVFDEDRLVTVFPVNGRF